MLTGAIRQGVNFFWSEVTDTNHADLKGHNIAAFNANSHAIAAARELERAILTPIRIHYGKAVTVNSWFRSPPLNERVGGSRYSQHMKGEAADIVIEGVSCLEVARWVAFRSGLGYGQVIAEDPNNDGVPTWVHVSLGAPWRSKASSGEALYFNGSKYTPLTRG